MPTGDHTWSNAMKRFGFIAPEDGSNDAFVDISAVERAGLGTLREQQRVSYELSPGALANSPPGSSLAPSSGH